MVNIAEHDETRTIWVVYESVVPNNLIEAA